MKPPPIPGFAAPSLRDRAAAQRIRRLAAAVACVGILAFVSLIVFFVVGGPFGFVNDVSNAVLATLAGMLAATWLRATRQRSPRLSLATATALAGTVAAVVGSAMVIFDLTGYFLAGLVSASGFALVGTWLIAANLSARGVMMAKVAGDPAAIEMPKRTGREPIDADLIPAGEEEAQEGRLGD